MDTLNTVHCVCNCGLSKLTFYESLFCVSLVPVDLSFFLFCSIAS